MTIVERLDGLVSALEEERRRPAASRETKASDDGIDRSIVDLTRARELWSAGEEAGALVVLDAVGRQAGDSWSYSSGLAVDVLALGQSLRRR